MIGKTLGHYQITEKLGAGGMGVVYKARDLHLDRFVAVKILPAEKVADPDRKRRFVQEAKAASALNHPNIVHVYDIDQSEGTDYIAMEYVEGKTLDQRFGHRGLHLNDALKYAVQIADALAKAHSAGIVHRDLKPTNIMVNEDGVVKVLDFGLAKLTEWVQGDQFASTATIDDEGRPITEEGVIVGTVSYMSPEQAEGKKVDTHSDIFSLGSVLYEMVTGQKAFQGTSKMSTLSAILHQEPKPVSGVTPTIPADLEKLINRCLRKDPAKRWQTMADLKVALDELKEDSDSGRLQAVPAKARLFTPVRLLIGAVGVVAVIMLAATGWYWLGRRAAEPEGPLTAVPLTAYPGSEGYPSFSPDDTQVAFEWCKGTGNCDIYVKQIGVEQLFQLTTDPAEDFSPAWSPDARYLAFMRELSPTKAAIVLIPQRGRPEQVLGESGVTRPMRPWGPYLAWTPDSKWLVFTSADSTTAGLGLFLLSVETLEKRRLTSPGAGDVTDTCPAVSPDGRTLAFTRMKGNGSDIYLLRLGVNYEPRGVPDMLAGGDEEYNSAAAWTPDGSEIVFSSRSVWSGGIWRVAASTSAKPRKLAVASEFVPAVAISRQGNRLAYMDIKWRASIWRVDLLGPDRTPGVPFALIPSTRIEKHPAYSPDGKRITFDSTRSGHSEIWVCNSDGSDFVKLTSFRGPPACTPRWSPDGRSIVFGVEATEQGGIYVISATGGPPRRLNTGRPGGSWPCWSRDSRSIYFKHSGQVWKVPASGGEAVQITRSGGDLPQESPDGKFLYYMKGPWPGKCSVWRMPVEGGEESKVLEPVHYLGHFSVGERGIYYFAPEDDKGRSDINFYDFATRNTSKILTIERPVFEHIEISPDGRTILYPQYGEGGIDLMLVDNFR